MKLQDIFSLITGGSAGIGEAMARCFIAEGAHVLIADVDGKRGKMVAVELGDRCAYHELDVSDESSFARRFNQ